MPLSLQYVQDASPSTILEYLPQLMELDLGYFERSYVLRATEDPASFQEWDRSQVLLGVVLNHRHQLEMIPRSGNSLTRSERLRRISSRVNYDSSWPSSTYGDRQIIAPSAFPTGEVPQVTLQHTGLVQSRKRSWEFSFMDDLDESDFLPPTLREMSQSRPDDEREPELTGNTARPLKELAAILPPGILGMQFDADGAPYNLIFRPEREDDPRRKLLEGEGWFAVKNHPAVLWSAVTLEAYNVLFDTGMEFKVSPKVKRWYDFVTSNQPLPSLIGFPTNTPLFDYQKEAVQFLVRRKRAMLSLSPGLGKTLTAATAAGMCDYIGRILVVCPASLLHYWHSELTKWSPKLPLKPMVEIWHRETGVAPNHDDILPMTQFWAITNPETLTRYIEEFVGDGIQPWDLMIVDESIMYKHRESKRSAALNRIAKCIPDVWLLTGAPATRLLDDMWHQFHVLNNRGYSSYWRFANRYCVVQDTVWAKNVVANRRNAEESIKENFRDVYFARSQEQVADIPDWLMEDMDVPMTPKQDKIYHRLQEELEVQIGDREDNEVITVDNRFGLILRSLQIASNPVLLGADNTSGKWSVLPELMEIYPGPYLVWVNFVRTGEMLQDSLRSKFGDDRVYMANGATPMEERQTLVDNFQAGKMDVLVLNSTVGKFGFTLTKARTSFFMERGYDDSYFQCLYRNRRIGTTISPIVVNMRSVKKTGGRTIDHVVHDSLDYRNSMIKKITIGDLRSTLGD